MRLASAAASCALVGLLVGLLTALSTGSLGDVRLLHVGPDPVFVGMLAFGLTAIGAVPTALALRTVTPPEVPEPRDKYYRAEPDSTPESPAESAEQSGAEPTVEAAGAGIPADVQASALSDQESEQING